ncbi:MAG: long-chain fatty acid--CoA ligase [Candidatus Electrothrix sp. LOE2]|nr:long-chain fatty acid--CoA ligase [Candidatus Electrothrix sp. LOE2]
MFYLLENFKNFWSKKAIVDKGIEYTYQQLLNEIQQILSAEIIGKIQSGEVVSILSDYSFKSIALMLALFKNRNIIVPITTTIEENIKYKIKESFTNKIIRVLDSGWTLESMQSPNHIMIKELQDSAHSGLILFSSGSTGKPKAMIHNFDNIVNLYEGKKEKTMNIIVFLMFDHIGGLNTLLSTFSMGATIIIPESRNVDDVCKLIQDYKVKVLPSSPTFLNLMLMSKVYKRYDLSSLRMITYGTEAMPESLLIRLKKVFNRTKLLQTFGTSETGIAGTNSKSSGSTFMRIEDSNLEYKIIDNELWLKSKTQIIGYLNSTAQNFTDDGWFKTGDLVETTGDGYLRIIGRNNEIINVGGEKVLPAEIESVILTIDEVEDVVIYGEDNPITGQSVVADIVPVEKNIDARTAKKLIRMFCRNKIDNYKLPTKVNIVKKINICERFKKIRRK